MRWIWSLLFDQEETFWVTVRIVHATDKAYLLNFDGQEQWFPKRWVLKKRERNGEMQVKVRELNWRKKFA